MFFKPCLVSGWSDQRRTGFGNTLCLPLFGRRWKLALTERLPRDIFLRGHCLLCLSLGVYQAPFHRWKLRRGAGTQLLSG